MKIVYKYEEKLDDVIEFKLPEGAEILRVDVQKESSLGEIQKVCLWALVDLSKETVIRRVRIAGTGHPIDNKVLRYINTFTMLGKQLWFHTFEITGI